MIPELFSFSDIQNLVAIKLCFLGFIVSGIFVVYKKWNPVWLLFLAGAFSALAYWFLVQGNFLLLQGLKGDEVTIAAMYSTFAKVGFFSDFSYHGLPPFYPPLFFWIFSFLGSFFSWNGVQIAKFSALIAFALFPFFSYLIQKWYARVTLPQAEEVWPQKISWILFPLLVWFVLDPDAIIGKPYEMIAAVGVVLWFVYLMQDVWYRRLSVKRILVYGVSGGILFLTYYLWLVFAAIAGALFGLWVARKDQWYFYVRLFVVSCVALLVASPYFVPLVRSYQSGTENWQVAFFVLEKLPFALSFLQIWSWQGLILLCGFFTLIVYRKTVFMRALLLLFVSAYVWYVMGLSTLLGFAAPMQEFKGFYFFDRSVLALAAAFGLVRAWQFLQKKFLQPAWQLPVLVVGLLVLGSGLVFGTFVDNSKIQVRKIENKTVRPTLLELIEFLQHDEIQERRPLTLTSGLPEVPAFVPLNQFLYYNQFNSHPAARFSERKAYLTWLKTARDSENFASISQNTWFGSIDQFILFKHQPKDFYPIYLYVDNFPNGAKEEIVLIKKDLIAEPYFEKAFENYEFVVWQRKSEK